MFDEDPFSSIIKPGRGEDKKMSTYLKKQKLQQQQQQKLKKLHNNDNVLGGGPRKHHDGDDEDEDNKSHHTETTRSVTTTISNEVDDFLASFGTASSSSSPPSTRTGTTTSRHGHDDDDDGFGFCGSLSSSSSNFAGSFQNDFHTSGSVDGKKKQKNQVTNVDDDDGDGFGFAGGDDVLAKNRNNSKDSFGSAQPFVDEDEATRSSRRSQQSKNKNESRKSSGNSHTKSSRSSRSRSNHSHSNSQQNSNAGSVHRKGKSNKQRDSIHSSSYSNSIFGGSTGTSDCDDDDGFGFGSVNPFSDTSMGMGKMDPVSSTNQQNGKTAPSAAWKMREEWKKSTRNQVLSGTSTDSQHGFPGPRRCKSLEGILEVDYSGGDGKETDLIGTEARRLQSPDQSRRNRKGGIIEPPRQQQQRRPPRRSSVCGSSGQVFQSAGSTERSEFGRMRSSRRSSMVNTALAEGSIPRLDRRSALCSSGRAASSRCTKSSVSTRDKWNRDRSRNQELIMSMYRDGDLMTKKNDSDHSSSSLDQSNSDGLDAGISVLNIDEKALPETSPAEKKQTNRRRSVLSSLRGSKKKVQDEGDNDEGGQGYRSNRDIQGRSRLSLLERVGVEDSTPPTTPPPTKSSGKVTSSYSDRIMNQKQRM